METKSPTKKRIVKRFFYLDDYEINYSNGKDMIMVKNYQNRKFYEFSMSGFILRYHRHLQQDKNSQTLISNLLIESFSFAIQKGKIKCEFFINDHDDKLWLNINNGLTEYYYDISIHFLVMCCNDGKYEWFSLLHNEVVEYNNTIFALNKIQFELLQSWIHVSLKNIYGIISHDTKD
jgi:hypothetical protein